MKTVVTFLTLTLAFGCSDEDAVWCARLANDYGVSATGWKLVNIGNNRCLLRCGSSWVPAGNWVGCPVARGAR